jgi:hypothetical protein
MTVTDGYRLQTGGTAVIGLVSAAAAWLLSLAVL